MGACEPDDSSPGKSRDVCILRVHLNFSKVGTQFQLLLWAQILVPEEHHASLRNQESELILIAIQRFCSSLFHNKQLTYPLLIGKILQLQANNFGADMDGHIFHLFTHVRPLCFCNNK